MKRKEKRISVGGERLAGISLLGNGGKPGVPPLRL